MRRFHSGYLLPLLVVLAAAPAAGQTVRGALVEDQTGAPIPLASVVLLDDRGREVARTTADEAGGFVLSTRRIGGYWVEAQHVGFQPAQSRPFVLAAGDSVTVSLRLVPQATMLEGLTVTASRRQQRNYTAFLERQRWGWGKYLGPEDIARRTVSHTSGLLMALPGLAFGQRGGVTIRSRGQHCAPTVYVDGLRYTPYDGPVEVDMVVAGSQVRAVEVYTSAMFVPVELQTAGATGCGAIILWTDFGLGT